MNCVYLDFEFNHTTEAVLNLVSVVVLTTGKSYASTGYRRRFWLDGDMKQQIKFNEYIEQFYDTHYFIAFGVIAEARSLLSLPFPPDVTKIKWIDLWVEYRNLLNHHHKTSYGKQLIKGKIKTTFPKDNWNKNSDSNNSKPEDNYAAACFKLLGIEIDTDRKNKMRDIIISKDEDLIEKNWEEILDYNEDDVRCLPLLLKKVLSEYKKRYPKRLRKDIRQWMLNRGEFAARTAVMEQLGYSINYTITKNFSDNVGSILGDIQGEINELFPDVQPFKYNAKTGLYSWDQISTKRWISNLPESIEGSWPRTPTKDYSLSVDSFTKFFNYRHTFPKDNLGAQFVRYLKTKQNLNGFSANTKKKTLWDSVGIHDGRVRPYTNIYRSQSSRSQPSSTSFLFLKSAWMRSLCQPASGIAMGGIDYGSQEFLIAGLEANDQAMIEAYDSGDVYLWFGKACKKIPEEATKESHKTLRDKFKSSVLGIQYMMGAESLAIKIANDTGEDCTEDEAQEFIDLFDELFWRYAEYRDEVLQKYREDGFLLLDDGWTMWGNNPNYRSVCNYPIQGKGAIIMRKAVALAQEAGLNVVFTLHDALYIEFPSNDLTAMDILAKSMDEAFRFYYPDRREKANVRLDGAIWSKDYEDKDAYVKTPLGMNVKKQNIYVDGRGREEYEKFKKYFIRDESWDLL